ncbi:DUF6416 domain-containing protein [Haloechinothrix salitolerans]|uniref:DUF6416 domain-containing protein n=1 Tax=Haloechinothrix salitolerans TaxID=926830 RepID=A0ABW2BZT4_9PSEU
MSDITVPVPDDRVAEFYHFFGLWLGGSLSLSEVTTQKLPEGSEPSKERRRWTGSDEDREDAEELWGKLNKRAKGFYSLLIDAPGTEFTGNYIAEKLNIPNGASGVAGVLSWPGRYCWNMNRHLPSQWRDGEDGAPSVYWMDADVAALFAAVRADLDG